MTAYRRDSTPGATWFFSLNLADCQSDLLTAQIDQLKTIGDHGFRFRCTSRAEIN